MIKIKNYKKVENLEEAWELNQKRTNRIIGGMLWVKMSDANVQTAIDLSGLGLDQIEETEEEFRIGCMVTLRQMELHEGLSHYTEGAVKDAFRHIVGVQFRNLATVGGSLFGRFGFSDVLTLLLALDCDVELYKGGIMSIQEFAKLKRDNDILVHIIIKKTPVHICYQSVDRNEGQETALAATLAALADELLTASAGTAAGDALLRRPLGFVCFLIGYIRRIRINLGRNKDFLCPPAYFVGIIVGHICIFTCTGCLILCMYTHNSTLHQSEFTNSSFL